MSRIASLDYVRGGAALVVAAPHYFIYQNIAAAIFEPIAILGVEIFFVLSGYVLAPQILMCLKQPNQLPTFLVRRWMRTIPAYAVALLCISILFQQFGSADFFRYLFYVQNLLRQSNETDYFSVAWSLSVEEWFYIVFPACMVLCVAVSRRTRLGPVIAFAVAFIAAITALRLGLGQIDDWGLDVRRVVLFRVDSIAYGFLLYAFVHLIAVEWIKRLPTFVVFGALVLISILSYWDCTQIAAESAAAKHAFPFLAACLGSVCIVLSVKMEKFVSARPLLSAVGLFSGRISYSVYLFHIIFVMLLAPSMKPLPLWVQFPVYLGLVIGFAAVFYHAFEKPILAARPAFGNSKTKPIVART